VKLKKYLLGFLIIITVFFNYVFQVEVSAENMNFSMSIVQPENQFDKDVTYFDILVSPGEKQKLKINVTNTGKSKDTFIVTPTNATTNSSGSVDYSKQKENYIYDKTLKIPFTSLVSGEQKVEIDAGKTKQLEFDFQAPIKKFDGIILGGFAVNTIDKDEEKEQANVSFINKFQIVKAIIIRSSSNNKDEKVDIKLNDVKPTLFNYRAAIVANVQNTQPVLLGKVNIKVDIKKENSDEIILSEDRKDVEFAPNSNFDFPIMWNNKALEPGKYMLEMKVTANKQNFDFKKGFNISKEDSYKIKEGALDLEDTPDHTILWIAIIVIAIIITVVLTLIIYKKITEKNSKNKKKIKKTIHKKGKNKKHK